MLPEIVNDVNVLVLTSTVGSPGRVDPRNIAFMFSFDVLDHFSSHLGSIDLHAWEYPSKALQEDPPTTLVIAGGSAILDISKIDLRLLHHILLIYGSE